MDRIVFCGTGGGRWSSIYQSRATGGFRLELGRDKIHVDPGPGAVVRCRQYNIDPRTTNAIFVSHCHLDHYNDLEAMIEAMCMNRKAGALLASRSVIEGEGEFTTPMNGYHLAMVEKLQVMGEGTSVKLKSAHVRSVLLKHADPTTVGAIFEAKEKIGYVADTEYFDTLPKSFSKLDTLIVNLLRPGNARIAGHICTNDAIKLLDKARPKRAIFQHFGLKMQKANPELEVQRIAEETGIGCTAATDGLVFKLGKGQKKVGDFANLK